MSYLRLVYTWYYFHLHYMFTSFTYYSHPLSHLLSHNFMHSLHFMLTNLLSSLHFIHSYVLWNHVLLLLRLPMYMLLSLSLHFMRYPVLSLLHSDFIYRSDLIRNLLHFHNFHLPNCMSNFHMLDLDLSHLHFMLFYYIHFRLHLLLLRLVLYDLYS